VIDIESQSVLAMDQQSGSASPNQQHKDSGRISNNASGAGFGQRTDGLFGDNRQQQQLDNYRSLDELSKDLGYLLNKTSNSDCYLNVKG
ncbi:unnamed protein product, partial [Didymodactylos carnosus]